jgi:sodium pump decarboxylase gamma subunit
MAETLENALLIAGIGMGLVFLSLILLWWLMEATVRLFKERTKEKEIEEAPAESSPLAAGEPVIDKKKRVAAAAVALALAASQASHHPDEESAPVSPWQVALRSRSFSNRSAAFGRKPKRNNP